MLSRVPLRVRVTLAFTTAMALLLVIMAAILWVWLRGELLDQIDTGLRFRASTIAAELPDIPDLQLRATTLVEGREALAQIIDARGRVLATSGNLAKPVLDRVAAISTVHPSFSVRRGPGAEADTRVMAIRVHAGGADYIVVTGASMSDRDDTSRALLRIFSFGGPVALALAAAAGWFAAGTALRPVERMRAQAAAISSTDGTTRLDVPPSRDELARLGQTLNAMLGRLDAAMRRERRFLDQASHELRTPVTALKAELDLACSRPRSEAELLAALASASEEADRLARLADELLVLARAHDGTLPVHREPTAVRELLERSVTRFGASAAARSVTIEVADTPDGSVMIDSARLGQALDNLVDNAIRYARTHVTLYAAVQAASLTIRVSDDGPGFDDAIRARAFAPFEHAPASPGSGLGLTIVALVAEGHGGTARVEGTSTVILEIPAAM